MIYKAFVKSVEEISSRQEEKVGKPSLQEFPSLYTYISKIYAMANDNDVKREEIVFLFPLHLTADAP